MVIRNRLYLAADAVTLCIGVAASYVARFESVSGLQRLADEALPFLLISIPFQVLLLWIAGTYRVLWRHAGSWEFLQLASAGAIAGGANFFLGALILPGLQVIDHRVPISILALCWLLAIVLPTGTRTLERMLYMARRNSRKPPPTGERRKRRVLIAGAGEAGRMVADELIGSPGSGMIPVGFLDDDPAKTRGMLSGLPVLGDTRDLGPIAETVGADELIIAMPSASGSAIRAIVDDARAASLRVRTVPSLLEVASGAVRLTTLRQLKIEDLLRRAPVETDMGAVGALVAGRRVLVTGAGGSIGSELCRQIAALGPESLALLGHGENSIFDIHAELRSHHPALQLETFIADIRDRNRLVALFEEYRPQLVFHAAAHKHVPLMERNPSEAVTNNIHGTRNVVEVAAETDVERLVMISTDKAVRPTNVMGASKRIAEQVVQETARRRGANFVAVRFGNVLGSRGSVVPTFLRQIADGGPLTLTHPDVRRYFMTIPEAVQLVLQAAVLGNGGEIFALDMGEAIRIVDLATDMVRLSGLEPGRDIAFEFTGLRPGEKLYEEVFFAGEDVTGTSHPKILHTVTRPLSDAFLNEVAQLELAVLQEMPASRLRAMLHHLVPEYLRADGTSPGHDIEVPTELVPRISLTA